MSPKDFLDLHLRQVPMHRAVLRAVECRLMSAVKLEPPVLDIGCGDGHFAEVTYGGLDAGIDIAADRIAEARRRNAYRLPAVASATALPFKDGSFATAISNCSIEHIPDLNSVLREVSRVLRPGGRFAFTVPSDRFASALLGSFLFRRLGFPGLGNAYGRFFNRISYHYHCYPPSAWHERLATVGMKVEHWEPYFSESACRLFDASHYLGASALLNKRLFGRWVLWPDKTPFWPMAWWLRRYYQEDSSRSGVYLFFVAKKMDDEPR